MVVLEPATPTDVREPDPRQPSLASGLGVSSDLTLRVPARCPSGGAVDAGAPGEPPLREAQRLLPPLDREAEPRRCPRWPV